MHGQRWVTVWILILQILSTPLQRVVASISTVQLRLQNWNRKWLLPLSLVLSGAFSIAAWSSTSLIIRLIQRINSLRWMLRQVHNTPDITSMPVIFRIPVSKLCWMELLSWLRISAGKPVLTLQPIRTKQRHWLVMTLVILHLAVAKVTMYGVV